VGDGPLPADGAARGARRAGPARGRGGDPRGTRASDQRGEPRRSAGPRADERRGEGRPSPARGSGRGRGDQRRGATRDRDGERDATDRRRGGRSGRPVSGGRGDRGAAGGRRTERDRGGRAAGGSRRDERARGDRRGDRRGDERGGRRNAKSPGHPSLPIRGRIVEYPSPRYKTAEDAEPRPEPRRAAPLRVRRGERDAKAPRTPPAGARAPKSKAGGGAAAPARRRRRRTEAGDELARLAGRDAGKAQAALDRAAAAYNEGRERDAARDLRALRDAYPDAAGVRELLGLADYRLGHFGVAAKELEAFVELTGSVEQHPVLMDSYRAQRRFGDVERCWRELAETSPSAELVTEGRIVAAGALADQGRVSEAIALLERKAAETKRAKDHHLRLWYALADLYERAGELPRARDLFDRIRRASPGFVDVAERLSALG
jgi:tetratricopeptide (TPR) repeat protein